MKLQRVRCVSATEGILHLSNGWNKDESLPLRLGTDNIPVTSIAPFSNHEQRDLTGYEIRNQMVRFIASPARFPSVVGPSTQLYLASSVNGWDKAIGKPEWEMQRRELNSCERFVLELPIKHLKGKIRFPFKFVTGDRQWLEISEASPNREVIEPGRYNLVFDKNFSGNQIFRFHSPSGTSLPEQRFLTWDDGVTKERWPLFYHGDLLKMRCNSVLGSVVEHGRTSFRVFAPRANAVTLSLSVEPGKQRYEEHSMMPEPDGSWSIAMDEALTGHFYRYFVFGENNDDSMAFDSSKPVLDPYAKATVSREGPGIIVSPNRLRGPSHRFEPPSMAELIIVEAHLRDLTATSPLPLGNVDRLGFSGLAKWALDKGNYLRSLGVNAIELQPLQEFDNHTPEEYHWGYMPVNYFAPSSAYSSQPSTASGIEEFRLVVKAFHDAGIAVLVDVVYNHVGLPAHLALLDKTYYFDHDESLEPRNWSGCGNDLRRDAPMVKRLVLESLIHWLETFDVDGFRFDLAELLEAPLLSEIELALRAIKPSVILIAEPWSFRGRIDSQLSRTSFSCWNDGFRDFIRDYVKGNGDSSGVIHYLKGSPGKSFARPSQSINYVESHDDHCLIDAITENPHRDGRKPTADDQRRSRMGFALTMMSQGVPMLAAGQDFHRSKSGHGNTYLRGDLNTLDYERLAEFRESHEYCRRWIEFRRSEIGSVLRLTEYQPDSFWQEFRPETGSAAALLLCSNPTNERHRLLFAINPDAKERKLPVTPEEIGRARLLATIDSFSSDGIPDPFERSVQGEIILPPLEIGLWIVE